MNSILASFHKKRIFLTAPIIAALLSAGMVNASPAQARALESPTTISSETGIGLSRGGEPTDQQIAVAIEAYYAASQRDAATVPGSQRLPGPAGSTSTPGHNLAAAPAIPAAVVAGAAICARGALGGVAGAALVDIYKGKASSQRTYVEGAVAGCLVSGLGVGGAAIWRLAGPRVRNWAINAVVAIIIRARGLTL